jgi:hypothetical protein
MPFCTYHFIYISSCFCTSVTNKTIIIIYIRTRAVTRDLGRVMTTNSLIHEITAVHELRSRSFSLTRRCNVWRRHHHSTTVHIPSIVAEYASANRRKSCTNALSTVRTRRERRSFNGQLKLIAKTVSTLNQTREIRIMTQVNGHCSDDHARQPVTTSDVLVHFK